MIFIFHGALFKSGGVLIKADTVYFFAAQNMKYI